MCSCIPWQCCSSNAVLGALEHAKGCIAWDSQLLWIRLVLIQDVSTVIMATENN